MFYTLHYIHWLAVPHPMIDIHVTDQDWIAHPFHSIGAWYGHPLPIMTLYCEHIEWASLVRLNSYRINIKVYFRLFMHPYKVWWHFYLTLVVVRKLLWKWLATFIFDCISVSKQTAVLQISNASRHIGITSRMNERNQHRNILVTFMRIYAFSPAYQE